MTEEKTVWFDTHAHLGDVKFDPDRHEVIGQAFQSGVAKIVEIADGPDEWEKAKVLAEKFPGKIWFTVGIHPYYADQNSSEVWKSLEGYLSHPQCVGLGEVGLDYAKCTIPKEIQKTTFRTALDLSAKQNKPLVIHCREAYSDLTPILRDHFGSTPPSVCPGVIHCFSGTEKDAQALSPFGFYFGVDGPLTYPSANPLREAVGSIPLDRLVLETDSPYLPPQSSRGKRNHPGLLPEIGARLAEIKKVPVEEAARQTFSNGEILYRLK